MMSVMVNGQEVVCRYNDTSHIYQPPRAHHCSVNGAFQKGGQESQSVFGAG